MQQKLNWIPNELLLLLSEYRNEAWGKQHSGWYVTATGQVFVFSWEGKYSHELVTVLSSEILADLQEALLAVKDEPYRFQTVAYDAGVCSLYGYLSVDEVLVEVVIAQEGDVTGELSSEQAIYLRSLVASIAPEGFLG